MRSENTRDGRLERRRFLHYLFAGAAAALGAPGVGVVRAPGAWAAAKPKPAPSPPGWPPDKVIESGITILPTDPAISAGSIEFPGSASTLQGYLATPVGGQTFPAILLVHDAFGLTEHERDVARRLAKMGYVTLALDLLSRFGGTAKAGTPAKITELLSRILVPQFLQDGNSSVRYLETHPFVSKSRIGMIGFGLGGLFSWFLLAENPDIKAGAIYYGSVPTLRLVPEITSSVLAIYGDTDGHDPDDLKELDAAMKKSGQPWSYKIEPKAGRGFFDDTRKAYVPDAAKDAWKMSLDWYTSHLNG